MGDRVYTIPFENISIGTAVQDIFALIPGAANGITLHHIHLEAAVSSEASLRMRLKRGSATVSAGSGGSAATVSPVDPADAGVTGTYRLNDTSQATTTGAFTTIAGFQWDVALPFDHLPAPEDRERCAVSGALILDLPATIIATTISGYVKFAEVP
jgi:hypothetical protein